MYRHFLVPIDDTDLSIELVGNAVGLAHAVGARVTFFHAVTGDARPACGSADASRVTPHSAPTFTGQAVELLAKAEAAARAFGVRCDSKHMLSDQPATAIVAAARGIGCDLIFMASHRHQQREPGAAPAHKTISAVLGAGLPVLVSSVGNLGPSAHVIGIIRDAHRALAVVLHGWMRALTTARSAGAEADAQLMRAIVRYVEGLLLTLYDPQDHLFKRLRKCTSAVNAELDELARQHARDREHVADLARRVATLTVDGEAAMNVTRDLDDAVRSYVSFVWELLGRTEGVILPAARRHLTEDDWSAIEAAFVKASETGLGAEAGDEARQLFSYIVNATGHLQ